MYNLSVLIVSVILSGSLSELPETFTLGIKLKLRNVQTEKLKMIVIVVIFKHVDGKPYFIYVSKYCV